MTKNEFMEKLAKELKARGVADAADIEEEYEQHFAFKLADGYSEEEIAAKLGDPAKLAAQFGAESAPTGKGGKKAAVVTGFVFLDIVTVLGFLALAAFALVLAAAAIGFAVVGVSLITKASLCGVIPAMPYGSAVILGIASLALAVLTGIGCAWYTAFVRQSVRAFCRFQSNAIADAEGKAVRTAAPGAETRYFTADLLRQREVNRLAEELTDHIIQSCGGELFALINNAGCARGCYMTTEDGYEQQFALNVLAGFLLTHRLLPLLRKGNGRVIFTSSESHRRMDVRWDDVMLSHFYNPLTAYKQSKLCDLLIARGLNDNFKRWGVRGYAVDPGLVHTDIGNKDAGGLVDLIWKVRKRGGVSPEVPAETFVYLCTEETPPAGLYYRGQTAKTPSRFVTLEGAKRFFALGNRLCGITFGEEDNA